MKSCFSLSAAAACSLARVRRLRETLGKAGIYPRVIRVPEGFTIYLPDPAVLSTNIFELYVWREYEHYLEFIPRRGWIVIDVGAHIGIYTLKAARLIGESGRVIALEPNPLVYYWLRINIRFNNAKNVLTLPVALGDYNGNAILYVVPKGNIGASSMYKSHAERWIKNNTKGPLAVKVPVYRLDTLASILKIKHVDLVKIDVEGAELAVLKGAEKLLQEHRISRLIIEVHTDVVSEDQIVQILRSYGYKITKAPAEYSKKILYAEVE